MFKSKKAKAQGLMESGKRAVGTITRVWDTGMTINDNPRVALAFLIEPLDGSPAFDGEKTSTVSRVQIPQVGQRYPVWYDAADPSIFAFAMVSDEDGRRQLAPLFDVAFGPDGSGIGLPASPVTAAPGGVASAATPDPLDQIRKLSELHQAGVLTDEEFTAKKAELLGEL